MATTRRVVLDLPEEDAALLDELVASGTYPSPDAAVSDALHGWAAGQDPLLERLLRDEVVPALLSAEKGEQPLLSLEQATARLNIALSGPSGR